MRSRILSEVARCQLAQQITTSTTLLLLAIASGTAWGQAGGGLMKDPSTGYVYRPVTRTIERPTTTTTMQRREQTVYKPQTVTETQPVNRTVFTPVVEYRWEPELKNRFNPFRKPAWEYKYVPRTNWETRSEVIHRSSTRTEWVAERRTFDVPVTQHQIVRDVQVDMQPVGKLGQAAQNSNPALAARLEPMHPTDQIVPFSASPITPNSRTQIADSTRSVNQTGHRPIELQPTAPGYLQTPASSIAMPPVVTSWR